MRHDSGKMEVFSAAVCALHTAEDAASGLEAMMPAMAELFSATRIIIDWFSLSPGGLLSMAMNDAGFINRRDVFDDRREWPELSSHPRLGSLCEPTAAPLCATPDGIPRDCRAYRPRGGAGDMIMVVNLPRRLLRITACRHGGFTEEDARTAYLLQQHLFCRFGHRYEAAVDGWELPLGEEGTVETVPDPVREIFRTYFEGELVAPDALPSEVKNWIRRTRSGRSGSRVLLSSDRLHVARPHGCLQIKLQYCGGQGGCAGLYIREERGRFNFYRLHALGLTERESEVTFWVTQGKADAEISLILGAARKTISKHVENILIKLAAGNRTQAAIKAIRWLADPSEEVR